MDQQEILEAFRRLGPEDQEAVRAEILGMGCTCMPPGMVERMKSMMECMQAGEGRRR